MSMAKRSSAQRTRITISVAAQRTGLSTQIIRHCVERELVDQTLTEAELARLRRIRRLHDLGINLSGIEIILRMRCQIQALQDRVARLESKEKQGCKEPDQ
jgi:DNA-binding transcriptional MerR regulator